MQRLIKPIIPEDNLELTMSNVKNIYSEMTALDFYKLNSQNFRSDEFITEHSGKHILFAGCSHTFGQGNLLKDVWSHKLYEELEGEKSGFFNLGTPGATYSEIAGQVLSYIAYYGVPDIVFILLPDLYREFGKIRARKVLESDEPKDIIEGLDLNFINANITRLFDAVSYMVESAGGKVFVSSNNIYLCTLDEQCDIDPRDNMENFYPMDYVEMQREAYDYHFSESKKSDYPDYLLNAFDIMHDGPALQHSWYSHFIKTYKNVSGIIK